MAVAIVLLALVFLLFCFSRKILNSNFYLIILILFFSGTSTTVVDIAFAQAGYLLTLLFHLILLVLFSLSFDENWKIKDKRFFAGLLILIVFLSVHGPLNFAYYLIPFLGGETLLFVLEYAKSPWSDVQKVLVRVVKIIIPEVIAIAVGSAGYYTISRHLNFSSRTNIVNPSLSGAPGKFIEFILYAIGYRSNVSLFSIQGIMNVLIVFGFIGIVICCILLFRKYYEQPFAMKILMNFSLFIFAIYGYFDFTCYCQGVGNERYFFCPWIFLIFLASYYMYTYIFCQGTVLKTVGILCLAAFSLPYMLSAIPQVARYPQAREAQLGLVNFLKDNDLEHGYATYWNAGSNMALSNFEVEIGGVTLYDPISPYLWLSSTTSYDPNSYSGKSFLLLTQEEDEFYSDTHGFQRLGNPEEILSYGNFIIYVYPYNIAENNFEGIGFPPLDYIRSMCVSDPSMRIDDTEICFTAGQVIYGPYISLDPGRYQIDVKFAEMTGDVFCRLTSDAGENILQEQILNSEEQTVFLDTAEVLTNFEVVFSTDSSATLSAVIISKID